MIGVIETALISIGIYIIYHTIKFYVKVYQLPKGPFPLPFIGNLIDVFFGKEHTVNRISRLISKYRPISTLWFGSLPVIIVNDVNYAKKVFNLSGYELHGRVGIKFKDIFIQNKGIDVLYSDASPEWLELRKLTQITLRNFSKTEEYSRIVSEVVDEVINSMIKENQIGVEFNFSIYRQMIVTLSVAYSAYGRDCLTNEKCKELLRLFRVFGRSFDKLSRQEYLPILSYLNDREFKRATQNFNEIMNIMNACFEDNVQNSKNTYYNNEPRNMSEVLIQASNKAIEKNPESVKYLTQWNLSLLIFDIFLGGIETTKHTTNWIFLLLSNYPRIQEKIRDEIKEKIGNRYPTSDDIPNCHFTNAFILEVLRFRNAGPFGVPHKAMADVRVDQHFIPKDSIVIASTYDFMNDEREWKDPHLFDPNRFLINGKIQHTINANFMPLGVGKRVCPGDKMFLNNAFIIITRSLQVMDGLRFGLINGENSADLEPNDFFLITSPKVYNIIIASSDK